MEKSHCDDDLNKTDDTDDNLHDFSVALDDLDDLILKLTQTSTERTIQTSLPQNDGSDDILKTPSKSAKNIAAAKTPPRTPTTPQRRHTLGAASPSRSPRTPKSGHKYKPLPLVITNRSTGKRKFIMEGEKF